METEYKIIKLDNPPSIISEFSKQDYLLLQKVKPENKDTVKIIIAKYGLSHPLENIFKKYQNDYEGLKKDLTKFSIERETYLNEVIKNL